LHQERTEPGIRHVPGAERVEDCDKQRGSEHIVPRLRDAGYLVMFTQSGGGLALSVPNETDTTTTVEMEKEFKV